MHTTRGVRLVLGTVVVFGAVASFGLGLAAAGTAGVDCEAECNMRCEGDCEEFAPVGCGCVWACSDGTSGEIVCG